MHSINPLALCATQFSTTKVLKVHTYSVVQSFPTVTPLQTTQLPHPPSLFQAFIPSKLPHSTQLNPPPTRYQDPTDHRSAPPGVSVRRLAGGCLPPIFERHFFPARPPETITLRVYGQMRRKTNRPPRGARPPIKQRNLHSRATRPAGAHTRPELICAGKAEPLGRRSRPPEVFPPALIRASPELFNAIPADGDLRGHTRENEPAGVEREFFARIRVSGRGRRLGRLASGGGLRFVTVEASWFARGFGGVRRFDVRRDISGRADVYLMEHLFGVYFVFLLCEVGRTGELCCGVH